MYFNILVHDSVLSVHTRNSESREGLLTNTIKTFMTFKRDFSLDCFPFCLDTTRNTTRENNKNEENLFLYFFFIEN